MPISSVEGGTMGQATRRSLERFLLGKANRKIRLVYMYRSPELNEPKTYGLNHKGQYLQARMKLEKIAVRTMNLKRVTISP